MSGGKLSAETGAEHHLLATYAGITIRYPEMIEVDSKTPSVPILRRLAKGG